MQVDAITAAIGTMWAVGLLRPAWTEAAVADFVFERCVGPVFLAVSY